MLRHEPGFTRVQEKMRTVAIANQKGGCGKTTTAVNLASAFSLLGKRVLLIDLDPQAHATLGLGCDPESVDKTVYNLFTDSHLPASKLVTESNMEGLFLLPSNILLSGVELELASMENREYVLTNRISEINGSFDICLIDCSPSLSLLTGIFFRKECFSMILAYLMKTSMNTSRKGRNIIEYIASIGAWRVFMK